MDGWMAAKERETQKQPKKRGSCAAKANETNKTTPEKKESHKTDREKEREREKENEIKQKRI